MVGFSDVSALNISARLLSKLESSETLKGFFFFFLMLLNENITILNYLGCVNRIVCILECDAMQSICGHITGILRN